MQSVGVRELKTHTTEILRRVRENSEPVEVTYRGEVVARIVPARRPKVSPAEARAIMADLEQLAAEIDRSWIGSDSASDAVREGRREL